MLLPHRIVKCKYQSGQKLQCASMIGGRDLMLMPADETSYLTNVNAEPEILNVMYRSPNNVCRLPRLRCLMINFLPMNIIPDMHEAANSTMRQLQKG